MAIDTPARIAVLGAGPIGLETALYGRYLGYDVDIYERGRVAEHLLRWGHVRMFSPFRLNCSTLGLAALRAQDSAWQPPADESLLTGHDFATAYLLPLAHSDLLSDGLHEKTEVAAVGRDGLLKGELVGDECRGDSLFRILLRSTDPAHHGHEHVATADIVIDTTGSFGHHNWLGDGGVPAVGELAAEPHIEYGLPDVLGRERDHYAGRNVLVVGAGYSAATNIVALADLAREASDTWITWITRPRTAGVSPADGPSPSPMKLIPNDPFGERDRLGRAANRLAADDSDHVSYWPETIVESLSWHADLARFTVRLQGRHAGELEVDRIIANVGYRGDSRIYRELQVQECYATGALPKIAAALQLAPGNGLDPKDQTPQMLIHPEPHFYILGAKSYGRDSRFLISAGLEQIRGLFSIIGDRADLNLYATTTTLARTSN